MFNFFVWVWGEWDEAEHCKTSLHLRTFAWKWKSVANAIMWSINKKRMREKKVSIITKQKRTIRQCKVLNRCLKELGNINTEEKNITNRKEMIRNHRRQLHGDEDTSASPKYVGMGLSPPPNLEGLGIVGPHCNGSRPPWASLRWQWALLGLYMVAVGLVASSRCTWCHTCVSHTWHHVHATSPPLQFLGGTQDLCQRQRTMFKNLLVRWRISFGLFLEHQFHVH